MDEQEMVIRKRGKALESDQEKWVYDSSLDHRGRLPPRASTGAWKAALFTITIGFSERLCFFGLSTNLITYLTKVIQQDLKTAVKNVNYWSGVSTMMPLIGGFLADSYTGRFPMILISSAIYIMGLGLLVMSRFIPRLKPCETDTCHQPSNKVHEMIFFLAIYFIALATGGYKPSLESFGADQFDDGHPNERRKKMSYFNWWNFSLCCGLVLGVTFIVYVQDHVSWGAADLILTIVFIITIIIFYFGKPFYRYRVPKGSPLTPMLQVLVAAIKKRNLPCPSTPSLLYEVPSSQNPQGRLLGHTNNLRFLDKAAIIEGNEHISAEKRSCPWRLATVTRVEELKLILNIIPIWLSSLAFGTCVAQTTTFFIKQSSTMNRKVGEHFEIPAATIYALTAIGIIIAVAIYDKVLVPALRRATGNERGINILQRIGFGMVFSVLSMGIAAVVERKRLGIAQKEATEGVSMSVFWLAPQFLLLGVGDAFTLVGLQEYFYDQVPDSMRSLGIALYLSVIGVGNFLSSILISVVNHITEQTSGSSWFGKDLNSSRVDNFYWLLAAMNGINIFVFVVLATRYSYKNVQGITAAAYCPEGDAMESP